MGILRCIEMIRSERGGEKLAQLFIHQLKTVWGEPRKGC